MKYQGRYSMPGVIRTGGRLFGTEVRRMFLLKGIIIGLIIGTPVGAAGALCMSRTLQYGARSGFITGIGCSAADCLYASVGVFGLKTISAFLNENEILISIAGGLIIMSMGAVAFMRKGTVIATMKKPPSRLNMFLTSFCVGITNPAVLIVSMIALSYFHVPRERTLPQSAALCIGFFMGTMIWWFVLIGTIKAIKNRYGNNIGNKANKVFGAIMLVLGAIVIGRVLFRL